MAVIAKPCKPNAGAIAGVSRYRTPVFDTAYRDACTIGLYFENEGIDRCGFSWRTISVLRHENRFMSSCCWGFAPGGILYFHFSKGIPGTGYSYT
jgi:hypothetical protein